MYLQYAPVLVALVEKPFNSTDAIERAMNSRPILQDSVSSIRVVWDDDCYIVEITVEGSTTHYLNIYMIVDEDCGCDDGQ